MSRVLLVLCAGLIQQDRDGGVRRVPAERVGGDTVSDEVRIITPDDFRRSVWASANRYAEVCAEVESLRTAGATSIYERKVADWMERPR